MVIKYHKTFLNNSRTQTAANPYQWEIWQLRSVISLKFNFDLPVNAFIIGKRLSFFPMLPKKDCKRDLRCSILACANCGQRLLTFSN